MTVRLRIEKIDEINSIVHQEEDDGYNWLAGLQDHFTFDVPGAKFNPKVRMRLWDGKKRFFNAFSRGLKNGLIEDTLKYAAENGAIVDFDGFQDYDKYDLENFKEVNKKILSTCSLTPRNYQEEAALEALNRRLGVLECCTSSGKSFIIYMFIRQLLERGLVGNNKILLIVPNISLVTQMFSDFKEYGWDDIDDYAEVLYGEAHPTYEKTVLISTWQSLQNKDEDFFLQYRCVIVDEAHGSKSTVINKLINYCRNAEFRIGTTGTLPSDPCQCADIKCVLGNTIYKITSKQLIECGVLTPMYIVNLLVKYPTSFIEANRNREYADEVKLIEDYPDRKKALDTIFKNTPTEKNSLILVNHISHLDSVADYLKEKYPDKKVYVVKGSVKASTREEIRKRAEVEDAVIIVATYQTYSTGVNIKKLHNVILYGNGKGKIKILQSLGRGLRKHPSKDKVFLYDVVDDMTYTTRFGNLKQNYLYKHWMERLGYYKAEGYPMYSTKLAL